MSIRQRKFTRAELRDQPVKAGDFFGTTSEVGSHVWLRSGLTATRVGIINPDHYSSAVMKKNETLRSALRKVPMFKDRKFLIHKMNLSPGSYYPRIARPNNSYPDQAPGDLPDFYNKSDILIGSLNELRSMVAALNEIFQTVHPVKGNMNCFGSSIRNLLILACTECEAQWRGVLQANGYQKNKYTTNDYVKLIEPMRLSEYSVKIKHFPWLSSLCPFKKWSTNSPTKTLSWYDSYNAVKHDREGSFHRSNLISAVQAVAAAWIMLAAQFGHSGIREYMDLFRYFEFDQIPRWRYSDIYTHSYDGCSQNAGPVNYPF
jgi:hypothetical protein